MSDPNMIEAIEGVAKSLRIMDSLLFLIALVLCVSFTIVCISKRKLIK